MKRDQFARDLRKLVKKRISSEEIFEIYPIFIESGLKVRTFAVKHGFELKEDAPKKLYKFVKKAPKPKTQKQIRKFSIKRAKKESEYILVKQKKFQEFDGCCEGCGTNQGYIDLSHRMPRDPYFDLIADEENLDWYCRERCHKNVELGYYDELKNGEDVKKYIKSKDIVFFREKYKQLPND